MKIKNILVVVVGMLGGVTATGVANAQEPAPEPAAPTVAAPAAPAAAAPAPAPAGPVAEATLSTSEATESQGHATGLMVQARVQAQSSLLSIGGSGFAVGYQGPSYSLGVGVGLTRLGLSSGGQSESATLFQIAPILTVDVWHSTDGRARANLVGSVGYARASLSSSAGSQSCTFDGFGNETCSNREATASVSLIPFSVGFGGDYYLSRNFALGAEFGLQAMVLAGASTNSGGSSTSVDAGGDLEFAYGALRATFVLGN